MHIDIRSKYSDATTFQVQSPTYCTTRYYHWLLVVAMQSPWNTQRKLAKLLMDMFYLPIITKLNMIFKRYFVAAVQCRTIWQFYGAGTGGDGGGDVSGGGGCGDGSDEEDEGE